MLDLLQEEKGSLKQLLEREEGGADSGDDHQLSSRPLLSMHVARFVPVTCLSVITGCLFPRALPLFCHLLPGFLLLSIVCEILRGLSYPWSPSHKTVPQGMGGQWRRLLLCSACGCSHTETPPETPLSTMSWFEVNSS